MIGWLGADGFDWLFFFLLSFLFIYSYPFLCYVLTTKILVGRFEHLDCISVVVVVVVAGLAKE